MSDLVDLRELRSTSDREGGLHCHASSDRGLELFDTGESNLTVCQLSCFVGLKEDEEQRSRVHYWHVTELKPRSLR
jgi:hypothetical protein